MTKDGRAARRKMEAENKAKHEAYIKSLNIKYPSKPPILPILKGMLIKNDTGDVGLVVRDQDMNRDDGRFILAIWESTGQALEVYTDTFKCILAAYPPEDLVTPKRGASRYEDGSVTVSSDIAEGLKKYAPTLWSKITEVEGALILPYKKYVYIPTPFTGLGGPDLIGDTHAPGFGGGGGLSGTDRQMVRFPGKPPWMA